jgi:hypothetical protein
VLFGTDQVVFRVPDTAPEGCWVPVMVRTGGSSVSNTVTMAITGEGARCAADVFPEVASTIVDGGKLGASLLARVTTRHDGAVAAVVDTTGDYHASTAVAVDRTPFPFHPVASLPPAGTCTAYASQGDLLRGDMLPLTLPVTPQIDLGAAFQLNGPRGQRTLTSLVTDARAGFLGGSFSNNPQQDTRYLEPGPYSINGFGGAMIGTFAASFNVPEPLTWTNRDQIGFVDRTQPLNVNWSGGDPGQVVVITGFSVDLPTNSTALFNCVARPASNTFAVPALVLANLPSSRPNPVQSKGALYVTSIPAASLQRLGASGLDAGYALFSYINGKSVLFR